MVETLRDREFASGWETAVANARDHARPKENVLLRAGTILNGQSRIDALTADNARLRSEIASLAELLRESFPADLANGDAANPLPTVRALLDRLRRLET